MPDQILLIADERILKVPIIENQEVMIDLKDQADIAYGPSPEIPDNQEYTQLRLTVYNKLKEAQKLLPQGLRFCLYEGYRSLETQKKLFEKHYKQLQDAHPEWDHERCFQETLRLVSPVINKDGSVNVPPHATGAAVDIYLIDDQGVCVDMGILVKDWLTDIHGELSVTDSNKISPQAKVYRKIMGEALEAVGFVNYFTEYWHWSYGDRYWAYHKKVIHAHYGAVLTISRR